MNVHQVEERTVDAAELRQSTERDNQTNEHALEALIEDEAIGPLLRRYNAESRRYRRRVRNTIRLGAVGAAVITLVDVMAALMAAKWGIDAFPFATIAVIWSLYVVILCAAMAWPLRSYIASNRLRNRLARYDDVRVVGPLAEVWCTQEPGLRKAAAVALTRLLPRLTLSDVSLLNPEQSECLCRILRDGRREETDLKLAVLQAFKQIGDSTVLPQVERLAESSARTRRQKQVRAEAFACLPVLRARAQQEQARQTLLRASSASGATPDSLLRPVTGDAPDLSPDLLRPTG